MEKFTFYLRVPGLMFETIEGGFLDIDVRIVGPDGKVIYQVSQHFYVIVCL